MTDDELVVQAGSRWVPGGSSSVSDYLEVKMTTKEDAPRPGLVQSGLVWVVGYAAVAVSVVLAVRFAYASADTTVDALIRGGAAAVAAVVGCHGPAWICRSVRMRAWGGALLGSLGFSICLAVTLAGGIGTIAAGSDKTLARRDNASTTYADRRKELESLRVKRADLPASRPAGTIEGDMTAARVDRRWSTSSSCTDATASASRTFCAEYARHQGELATAKEAAVLDEKIRELSEKLETAPAVRAANPQAEVIARLLHVAREDAEAWYALLFALAVEAAAMSVLVLAETATHHHQAAKSVEPPTVVQVQRTKRDSRSEAGQVLDWMPDRTIPTEDGTSTTLEVLHADYEVWCCVRELKAVTVEEFAETFDRMREIPEVAGNITKRGNRYYGIKLVDTKVAKLPVPKREWK
jgi:hypothetical protein